MRLLLLPFSWIYGFFVVLRNKLFDLGLLRAESFGIPVITVGNLSVGGTGKSPLVMHLASHLAVDFRIAVLSRGYGRRTKGFVLADSQATAVSIGDEPLQYYRQLTDVKVAVCEKRAEGIRNLLHLFPDINLIILDDAYQHRYVKPRLNVLVTTFQQPYYQDALLPAGRLREPVSGACRADIIIVTKCPELLSAEQQNNIRQKVRPVSHQQLYFSYIRYRDLRHRKTGAVIASDTLKGKHILLVCGIARPEPLNEYLTSCGAIIESMYFADHHDFSSGDALAMVKKYQQSKAVLMVTTGKDAMRLEQPELQHHLDRMEVYIMDIAPGFSGANGDPADHIRQLLK